MRASHLLPLVVITWTTWPTMATMYESLPILWVDTKTSLKSGDSEIQQAFKFHDPCDMFYDPSIVNGTQEYFVDWCRKQIDEVIIKPLEDMCRPDFVTAKTRKKRFFGRIFRYARSAFYSVFGIRAQTQSNTYQISHLTNRVNELSLATNILRERIEAGEARKAELESKVKELESAVKKLDERVTQTEINVEELQVWKDDLIKTLGSTMTLTSKLTAYFEISKSHMNEVKREWKEKRLSLHLFDIFMVGSNSELTDEFRGTKPMECYINTRDGVATFLFRKEDTDFGVHVLKANPFTMYKMIEGSHLGYKLEYVGPTQIAYDSKANCIVPFSGTATEVVLFPGMKDCLPMNDLSVYKYWRKTCELMYYLDETAIQFKSLGDSYYIYCFGFNIRLYKTAYPCPNHVFKVHVNETIEIMNDKTVSKMLKPEDFEKSPDFYSNKIVYHLMPQIMKLDIENFNLSNSCPSGSKVGKIMAKPEFEETTASGSASVYIILGVFALAFVAFGLGLMYYVKNRTAPSRYQTTRPDQSPASWPTAVPLLAIQSPDSEFRPTEK